MLNEQRHRLIPSLDGNFYLYYSDGLVRPIAVSADSLLRSTLKFGQNSVAGGRLLRTFSVDLDSGEVVRLMDGCIFGVDDYEDDVRITHHNCR